ncbi:Uncharacterised protein [Mycobacteroides abscessus subsp. abscessus]|nr:Uncharacterised protein [Mycobacteroides abscessus subsp. abscessus]
MPWHPPRHRDCPRFSHPSGLQCYAICRKLYSGRIECDLRVHSRAEVLKRLREPLAGALQVAANRALSGPKNSRYLRQR